MPARKQSVNAELREALATVAPGTPLRAGLERVVRAKGGALLVVNDGPDVLAICSGGFPVDAPYSPQRLSELAKMDGAIILSVNCDRIARANVTWCPTRPFPPARPEPATARPSGSPARSRCRSCRRARRWGSSTSTPVA